MSVSGVRESSRSLSRSHFSLHAPHVPDTFKPSTRGSVPVPYMLALYHESCHRRVTCSLESTSDFDLSFYCDNVQGALAVLEYQRQYLALHKKKLEEWACTVYGLHLAGHGSANEGRQTPPPQRNEVVPTTSGPTEVSDAPEEASPFRKVFVSLRCKGADRRRIDGALVAHVGQSWQAPRSEGSSHNNNKRKKQEVTLAEPSKRSKPCQPLSAKHDASGKRASDSSAAELDDDEAEPAFDACAQVPEAPGQIWTWLEDRKYFRDILRRQPLPEDLTVEANRCVGGGILVPVQGSAGSPRKAIGDPGARTWIPKKHDKMLHMSQIFMWWLVSGEFSAFDRVRAPLVESRFHLRRQSRAAAHYMIAGDVLSTHRAPPPEFPTTIPQARGMACRRTAQTFSGSACWPLLWCQLLVISSEP